MNEIDKNNFLFILDSAAKNGAVHVYDIPQNMTDEELEHHISENLNFSLDNIQWMVKNNKSILDHT